MQNLTDLKNIGNTVAKRLNSIGILTKKDLKQIGSVKAYQLLSHQFSDHHLPVCYYLYSLEGALQNRHWNDLSKTEKEALKLEAKTFK
jgi:DNA transformation protein